MEYGKDGNEPEFILATTAVAHTFCRNHLNCEKSPEIQRIVTFLESNLRIHLDRISDEPTAQEKVMNTFTSSWTELRRNLTILLLQLGIDFTERCWQCGNN